MPSILVIDDDRSVRRQIESAFQDTDVTVECAATAAAGIELLRKKAPDAVLLDIMLPEQSGLELFQEIHSIDSRLPVMFITATDSSDTAIEAMTLGAFDYLLKPLDLPKLREAVQQAAEIRRLANVPVAMPGVVKSENRGDLLVGRSPKMQEVYKAIGRVAPQDVTVLVRGESGTGKELVARAIYQHSARHKGPFLAVNCAAIPDALLESELFGHEKGSFTGADQRRIGKFEQCSGGTLFMDEVGDMSPLVQSKLLRVLQNQEFERVGGNTTIKTDVRVVAATNCNLEKMVAEGEFRPDLYYRLSGFAIHLPALRERSDDLLLLIDHFLARFNQELGKDVHGFSPSALDVMTQYGWPGNIRELQNVLKQAMLQATGPVLITEFLPAKVRSPEPADGAVAAGQGSEGDLERFLNERLRADTTNLYADTLERMERYLVSRVLHAADGNQSKAARILGITRGSLRNKIRTLGITIDRVVTSDDDLEEEESLAT